MVDEKKREDLQNRVNKYIDDVGKCLNKHKLRMQLIIRFPVRESVGKKAPLLSRLAIRLIRAQGGIIDSQFFDNKK